MEVVTVATTIGGVVNLVLALATLAGTGLGIYQALRSRKFRKAVDLSQTALETVVAVLDAVPANATVKDVKRRIRVAAEQLGVEGPRLAETVERVYAQMEQMGVFVPDTPETVRLQRAVEAVALAREQRAKAGGAPPGAGTGGSGAKAGPGGAGVIGVVGMWVIAGAAAVWLSGCAPATLTHETLLTEGGVPVELVVEWPEGVSRDPGQYMTVEVGGKMLTVAPVIDGAVLLGMDGTGDGGSASEDAP